MEMLTILIPLLPLIGFTINGLFGKSLSKSIVGIIGSGAVLASFILSIMAFSQVLNTGAFQSYAFNWITVGSLKVDIAFQVDQLSAMMMLIITGIGFLIHIFYWIYA